MEARFNMSYTKELVFEENGYNGFPDAKDMLVNNRRHISLALTDIPALHNEPHSFYDLHRMRAEYRIHYFSDDNDKTRLYTWDDLGKRIFEDHYKITPTERA